LGKIGALVISKDVFILVLTHNVLAMLIQLRRNVCS